MSKLNRPPRQKRLGDGRDQAGRLRTLLPRAPLYRQRQQKAKQMGVLSKGETDRAADTLIAESPNATAPPTKVEIKTPRQPMAESIVKTSATYAGAAGLLSLGFVDILVVPVIQLKMLQNL